MQRTDWWKDAVIYQIYPKSFNDSNDDGIGDIKGIQEKIPYLKELGVDALWLSPVYLSPQVDNGYDIADYRQMDPMFGTNQDMFDLIDMAHENDIRIIMDFVANHTSDQCIWFKESCKGKDNFFSNFYIWKDAKPDGSVPNNWGSNFGGSAWEWNENRQQYYLHYYAKEQPDLNWENPHVRQYIYDMMRFWKAHGVDGWRMDVITSISKDLDFPDNEVPLSTKNQQNGPRMHEFIRELNAEVLTPFDMMSVGESPDAKSHDAWKLVAPQRKELDMIFTFEHMHIDRQKGGVNGRWDHQEPDFVQLKEIMSNWQNELYHNGWNSLYFENHDRARVVSRWGNDEKYHYESATAFATILHGMQGTPYIFQGEEIGMTNAAEFDIEDYEDIELLGNYEHYVKEAQTISHDDFMHAAGRISRDHARTPMQWDDSANAGFSSAEPWFHVNPDYKRINVKKDRVSSQSIFYYYQQLIQLRHQNAWLKEADYQLLLPEDPAIFAYLRNAKDGKYLIVGNLSEKEIELPEELKVYKNKKTFIHNYEKEISDVLSPYESYILQVEN
ncbi:glycoside hydrolase family 13 protein [Tetragenococcus halophilus]|uniref:glycoside hydrolase family 13 protein n=1 Tax=Tetragenococcus halophilus TaxID=51669 RepID=UPI0015C0DFF9|nr:alpha-glucosidase [Tetragenococcus halophilus]NWO01252.1 alpha-glucosidase [Tetragenococcus halophilus]